MTYNVFGGTLNLTQSANHLMNVRQHQAAVDPQITGELS